MNERTKQSITKSAHQDAKLKYEINFSNTLIYNKNDTGKKHDCVNMAIFWLMRSFVRKNGLLFQK